MSNDDAKRQAEKALEQIKKACGPMPELTRLARENRTASQRLAEQLKGLNFEWTPSLGRQVAELAKAFDDHRSAFDQMKPLLPLAGLQFLDMKSALFKMEETRSHWERLSRSLAITSPLRSPVTMELERLSRSIGAMMGPTADFSETLRCLHAPQFNAFAEAMRRSTEALRPYGNLFEELGEDERIANIILELGFVPHGELWIHFADVEFDEDEATAFACQLAHDCWGELKPALVLDNESCMHDEKLAKHFEQMLAAHDADLYEVVRAAMPGVLERAVRVAFAPDEPPKLNEWIKHGVGNLSPADIGGIKGYRVWKILVQHTFASFKNDEDADAIQFPNRHSAAHGGGRQVANVIDSLNAILLSHFVIELANVQKKVREVDARLASNGH